VTPARFALVFPGQGSQWVGMGRDVYDAYPVARAVFAQADEALGEPLTRLCFEGPADALENTLNAQPAILAASIALWRVLEVELGWRPLAAAGHSLGEYSALVAAGALEFAEAVRLVRERGRCMEAASGSGAGMLVVLGLDESSAREVAAQASAATGAQVSLANYNCPGQLVLGGEDRALEAAAQLARQRGAKRALRLPISVASHTPLMAPAAERFAAAVARTPLATPAFPVVGNAFSAPLVDAEAVRRELPGQLVRPVDWPACVRELAGLGAHVLWEVGPRSALAGLCKRLEAAPTVRTLTTAEEVGALLQEAREG